MPVAAMVILILWFAVVLALSVTLIAVSIRFREDGPESHPAAAQPPSASAQREVTAQKRRGCHLGPGILGDRDSSVPHPVREKM